jgi:hypothetical protein
MRQSFGNHKSVSGKAQIFSAARNRRNDKKLKRDKAL